MRACCALSVVELNPPRSWYFAGVPPASRAAFERKPSRTIAALMLLVFVVVVLRHAWMMDDAYITLRVVANLFDGHGLVWNPGERVWVYTHPLWLALCCGLYAITRELFYSLLITSTLLAAGALAIVAIRLPRSALVGAALVGAATLSQAFVDYSTSGLENALTFLLIALSAWVYFGRTPSPRRLGLLCLLGGLALLCRPDNALLLGPVVLAAGVQAKRRGAGARELLRAVALGGIPLWTWELFALFYYGTPIPNTALAKLNTAIEARELIEQGLFYCVATLDHDPVTLVVIAAGLLAPIVTRDRRALPFAVGIGLSLAYMVWIGGDFMLGRLFTAPLLMALVCLSRLRRVGLAPLCWASAGVALLGLAVEPNNLEISRKNSRAEAEARTPWRITDERALLYAGASLVHGSRTVEMPRHRWTALGLRGTSSGGRSEVATALGFRGFAGGPKVHWIDDVALTDALLSRLPARYDPLWMHGHFTREIPAGYLATIEAGEAGEAGETGENQLVDPNMRALYGRLALVTRGPLWSRERFAAIWWLNTGGPDELVDVEAWRFFGAAELSPESLARLRVPDGTPLDAGRARRFPTTGVLVEFAQRQHRRELELSINDDDRFELRFYDGDEEIARLPVPRKLSWSGTGLLLARRLALPEAARERGFTRLRILPRTQTQTKGTIYAIGHLLFDEAIEAAATESPAPPEPPPPTPEVSPEDVPSTPPR